MSEIIKYINQTYPYYSMDAKAWQNSIRQNLSNSARFHQVLRAGRGNLWTMEVGDPLCSSKKPQLSYSQMIAEALMQAEDRSMPLSEILTFINRKYPHLRMDAEAWQRGVRSKLSVNPCFKKVPRSRYSEGIGEFWTMEDGAEKLIFQKKIPQASNQKSVAALDEEIKCDMCDFSLVDYAPWDPVKNGRHRMSLHYKTEHDIQAGIAIVNYRVSHS